jgi:hypothetical protein
MLYPPRTRPIAIPRVEATSPTAASQHILCATRAAMAADPDGRGRGRGVQGRRRQGNGRKGMRGLRARTTLKQAPVCSELMSFRSARELLQPAGDGRASSAFCRLYVRATVLSSDPHCFRLSEGRNFLLIDRVMHQSDGLRYGLLRWLIVSIVWTGTNA